jgi:eukaryotic-like serine/threonine-protein kinase
MHRSTAIVALLCSLALFAYFPSTVYADWSMDRGNAARTAEGTGNAILEPTLLWNRTLSGNVWSPPAVINGVAYVGSDDGYVYALNASTGDQLWNCSLGHISYSTPAVANGYLFVGSHDHYNILNSTWDPTFVQLPNAYKGYVNAINIQTGESCWNRTFETYVSAPIVSENIVYVTSDKLYALRESSGQTLWASQVGGLLRSLSVADGKVFTSGPYAYDAVTGYSIWIDSRNLYDYPIFANDTIYTANILGKMAAFKADTGEELWNVNVSSWSSYAPAISNGVLFLGSEEYQLCALNGTNGKLLWNVSIGSQHDSISPVIVSDILYLSYFDELYTFNATNGNQLWNYNMTTKYGTGQLTDAVVDNGTIYVAARNSLYAIVDKSTLPQTTTSPVIDAVISSNPIVIIAAIAIIAVAAIMVLVITRYQKKSKTS